MEQLIERAAVLIEALGFPRGRGTLRGRRKQPEAALVPRTPPQRAARARHGSQWSRHDTAWTGPVVKVPHG